MRRVSLLAQNAATNQRGQTIRQNVARDGFLRLKELAEAPLSREHQIANDEQRPAVADQLERGADWASRSLILSHAEILNQLCFTTG
jgi:hypothetical protein